METGISLMELDCHSLTMVISMRLVKLRELTYVVGTMLTLQLASVSQCSALYTQQVHLWCMLIMTSTTFNHQGGSYIVG